MSRAEEEGGGETGYLPEKYPGAKEDKKQLYLLLDSIYRKYFLKYAWFKEESLFS